METDRSNVKADRELLELAAKAAGYEYAKHGGYIVVDGIPGNWNALTDDGDALRLAVKLRLTLSWDCFDGDEYATATRRHSHQGWDCVVDEEVDHQAAMRRSIVRCAAAIGEQMP